MKRKQTTVDFFLGASGPNGFQGYFAQLAQQPSMRMYLIKAGPGCGKSSLMKRIGQTMQAQEYLHCSSDPDSLDGIVFHHPPMAMVDATAPHTLEPDYPGSSQQVVDLHHTLDNEYLSQHRPQVEALFAQNQLEQKQAAEYLSCAYKLLAASRKLILPLIDQSKLYTYLRRLAFHTLGRTSTGKEPVEQIRLLSAVTPKGHLCYYHTIPALSQRQIVFHDETGAVAGCILAQLRKAALELGYSIISCPCPLDPERLEHLFIPQLGLAFLTSNSWHPMHFDGQKNIHCQRFLTQPATLYKKKIRLHRKLSLQLVEQASMAQRKAKQTHDLLEEFYRTAADFKQVDDLGDALIDTMKAYAKQHK